MVDLEGLITSDTPEVTQATIEPTSEGTPASTEVAPPEVKPAELPKMDDLEYSSKLAHLAKQEKSLVAKKQELSNLQKELDSYKSLQELAKSNPMAILDHFGLTYDALTDALLTQQDPDTKRFNDVKAEIEALKKERQLEAERVEQARNQEAENAYKWGIQKIAEDNGDEFELVKHYAAYDSVYEVCKQYYEQTNQMLDLKEALQLVEKDLEEQLNPIVGLKKVKSKFATVQELPVATTPPQAEITAKEPAFSKTPVVSGGTSSAPRGPANSEAERRERALAWLK